MVIVLYLLTPRENSISFPFRYMKYTFQRSPLRGKLTRTKLIWNVVPRIRYNK